MRKKEVKLSLFTNDMILYIGDPKEFIGKATRTNKRIKVAR